MRAVIYRGPGGPEVVEIRDVAEPTPGHGEVLVRVRAAGLNRADVLQRMGLYPPPPGVRPEMPGLELAGEVAAVGGGVNAWRVGDRVMAITAGEAQAEHALVHERMLVRVPDNLTWEQAGAVPEAFVTAHDALFTLGGLRPGWPVLVHAVGSGVATAAVQLARAAGATVLGTSRSDDKLARAQALGMDHGILVDGKAPKFADKVRELTGGAGVPVVLDFVGGAYAAENLGSLAPGGRLIVIGLLGGPSTSIDLGLVLRKRLSIVGTVLRSRPLEDKIRATQDFARDVGPLLASGRVAPVVDAVLPLDEVAEAHRRMESNANFGKIVLTM